MATKKKATKKTTQKKKRAKAASASAPSGSRNKKKRGSGKRDLVKTPTASFFARRTAEGQFKEMDEVGRSLAADRRQKAKSKVGSGYGDRGDR